MPAVNQIEVHPYFTNEEVRAYGARHGIVTEAWSPIAQGAVLDDPVIGDDRRAGAAARPPRSCCAGTSQRGDIVFPKSVTPERIEENFALFDFELDDDAMTRAQSPRTRARRAARAPNPDTFDYIPR